MITRKQKHRIKTTTAEDGPVIRHVSFRARFVAAWRLLQSKRLVVPVIILVILLVGGSALLYHVSRIGHKTLTSSLIESGAPPFPQTYLVFQNLQGSPATSSITTLVHRDGVVQRQFSSNATDGTFDEYAGSVVPSSSGLLMSNQLGDGTDMTVTDWTELHANGVTLSVAPALTGTLNNIWNNSNIIDGNMFLVGGSTLYGVFANSESYNFQEVNLQTGIVQSVLQIKALGSSPINNNDVQPKTMNANQTEISFIMNDVLVNGQDKISTPSVVVYDIVSGKLKITALPTGLSGIAPAQASQAPMQYAISADGTLLAYQQAQQETINGIETTWLTTHVYNTQTGKDVIVSGGPSINLGACTNSFSFSNDNKYLVTCGSTSVTEDAIVEASNVATGVVTRTIVEGNTSNYSISPVGWSAQDELVYVTNTTVAGQPFDAATETAYGINLNTGNTYDYPTGLGELLMVIH